MNDWYDNNLDTLRGIARRHGTSLSDTCGVASALSPRVQWERAVTMTDELLASWAAGEPRRPSGCLTTSYSAALRVLELGPERALVGPKTQAFYRALMGDHGAVVIDVWIIKSLRVRVGTPKQYAAAAAVVRYIASELGTSPRDLQAELWVQARGRA